MDEVTRVFDTSVALTRVLVHRDVRARLDKVLAQIPGAKKRQPPLDPTREFAVSPLEAEAQLRYLVNYLEAALQHTKELTLSAPEKLARIDESKQPWCLCRKPGAGEMIGCDNDDCEIQWFHIECVGLKQQPRGLWYCPRCRGQMGLSDDDTRGRAIKKRRVGSY